MLAEQDFVARWEAALALKREKEVSGQKQGQDHLKNKNKPKKGGKKDHGKNNATVMTVKATSYDQFQKRKDQMEKSDDPIDDTTDAETTNKKVLPVALLESQENPDIDPCQSLFCTHVSTSHEENVKYMHHKYGFFIPDQGM
jgi:hypothetical protein